MKGLPPGTWTAVAYAKVGPAWFEGSAETDGSKPVTLELEGLDDR